MEHGAAVPNDRVASSERVSQIHEARESSSEQQSRHMIYSMKAALRRRYLCIRNEGSRSAGVKEHERRAERRWLRLTIHLGPMKTESLSKDGNA